MADDFQTDVQDFSTLSRDLGKVPRATSMHGRQAVEVSATNIRDDWRTSAQGMAHAPQFPGSITYDMTGSAYGGGALGAFVGGGGDVTVGADIGPEKDRPQGSLGNLIEFGSVNNPPMGLGHGALQRNEADFERGIDRAVDDALKESGL